MVEHTVQCGNCGRDLDETPSEPNRTACPNCNSFRRAITISVVDEIQIKEQIGMKVKDPTSTTRGKITIEQLCGDDLHRKSGKWYKKVRVIDRENNRYLETVTDPETGEVIHHCEEPLSDHFGHGTAKAPQAP